MHADPDASHPEPRPDLTAGIVARFGQVAAVFVLQAVILFLCAGRLDWTWAWVFLAICVASVCVNGAILLRTRPETVAERGRPTASTRGWDKLVAGLWSLALFVVVPLVAGLDVRSGWSGEFATPWHVAGAVALACGLALGGWAMISNAYFSTAVRIQSERGHTVCRTGPYRFVRHPGYAGFILQSLATPLLLGSWWALIPGLAAAGVMVVRTSLEDRMLRAELPGYREFAEEVGYRLVPGIF
jgi:protein-S-isoprenylcysteine O-methyltransferase Ste14